jgi:tetratricopeptide (TPR) repeat protein
MSRTKLAAVFAIGLILICGFRAGAQESPEAKARRLEIERENARITALNETLQRSVTAGNQAFAAGNYDEAIKQYNEGLAADPKQVVLLVNRATVYKMRGVAQFNAAARAADLTEKVAKKESAGNDFRAAFDSASRAVALAKAGEPSAAGVNAVNAYAERAEAGRLLSRVDASVTDAVFNAYEEYVAIEPDEGKRLRARNVAAQMLLDAGAGERAVTEFRKLVNENGYNVDALLGLGLALFTTGDQSRFKEAGKYLQDFVKLAPDSHPQKPKARQTLRELGPFLSQ